MPNLSQTIPRYFGGLLVNAAFLLVTSALVVGQAGGGAADKKPDPKPAAAASSCGHDCGCFGHRLRDRLSSVFSRQCNDACKTTACPSHHVHTPIFRSSCDNSCGRTRLFNWQPLCREHKACAPAKCDPCERPSLLSRLRERFQRDRCCTSTASPAKATEKVDQPKKLPKDKEKGKEEVRIETNSAPVAPAAIEVNPQVPAVDITPVPAPAPRVTGERRDPF